MLDVLKIKKKKNKKSRQRETPKSLQAYIISNNIKMDLK
jgi:hypothetical protein